MLTGVELLLWMCAVCGHSKPFARTSTYTNTTLLFPVGTTTSTPTPPPPPQAAQTGVSDRDTALDTLADELVSVSALCDEQAAAREQAQAQVCGGVCDRVCV